MSEWYDATEDNLNIDLDDDTINFQAGYNDSGNIYWQFPVEVLRKLIAKYDKAKTKQRETK